MRRLFFFHLLLLANACHFACSQETKNSKADSTAITKPNTQAYADSTESFEVNASGDSVPYFHWAADDDVVGLAEYSIRRPGQHDCTGIYSCTRPLFKNLLLC